MDEPFHGVFPYLVSPVEEDGRIKDEVLARLVEHLIGAGVHGLTPLGSTGEFAYLSFEQRRRVVEVTLDAAAGRVPVVAGVAATTTADAVRQAQAFERMGCAGVLAILEAYFPIPDEGVHAYFSAIARAVSCPIVLYSNPQSAVGPVPARDRAPGGASKRPLPEGRVHQHRRAALAHEPPRRPARRLQRLLAHPGLRHAAGRARLDGGPRLRHAAPERSAQLCRAGRFDDAMGLQRPLWRINQLFAKYALAACIKGALEVQGFEVGRPLPPQPALDEAGRAEVRAMLEELGALRP
jgi:4-hydroxy-tetrahydrodipicolinate synthase